MQCAVLWFAVRFPFLFVGQGLGSWEWLRGKDTATRIDTTMQRMLRLMVNSHYLDEEKWLNWHMRSMSATRLLLTRRERCPWTHTQF